jgi:hypothetical protein
MLRIPHCLDSRLTVNFFKGIYFTSKFLNIYYLSNCTFRLSYKLRVFYNAISKTKICAVYRCILALTCNTKFDENLFAWNGMELTPICAERTRGLSSDRNLRFHSVSLEKHSPPPQLLRHSLVFPKLWSVKL